MTRQRIRDLGITIGDYPTGPDNAITDVPGVLVGHSTIIRDEPRMIVECPTRTIWNTFKIALFSLTGEFSSKLFDG